MYKCGKTTAYRSTWEDEEDPRDKRQDSAVRPDVADVVEDEADEHEEEADQRERSGWADHLWEEAESRCLTIKVQNNSLKKDSFRCNISVVSSQLYGDVTGLSGGMWGGGNQTRNEDETDTLLLCALLPNLSVNGVQYQSLLHWLSRVALSLSEASALRCAEGLVRWIASEKVISILEKSRASSTRGSGWLSLFCLDIFWWITYQKKNRVFPIKHPQLLMWSSSNRDTFEWVSPKLLLKVRVVTHWACLLWTLTSAGRSWAWCTRWWSSDRSLRLMRKETKLLWDEVK